MNALYFIGVGQALFIAALILTKPKIKRTDVILLIWMLLNGCQIVFFYVNFVGATGRYLPLLLIGGTLQFLVAPLLFLYIKNLTETQFSLYRHWPHAVPFVLITTLFLYYIYVVPASGKIWVGEGFIHVYGGYPFILRNYSSLLAFSSFIYPVLSLILLFKHKRKVLEEFSYKEEITLNWLRHWVILELVAFIISYVIIWAGALDFVDYLFSFHVVAFLVLLNVFIVGLFGLRQPEIFYEQQEEFVEKTKYRTSTLNSNAAREIVETLQGHMEKHRPYLNQKLGILDLAEELSISKHHLSQALNDDLATNFYDFVNGYRVEAFKNAIRNPANKNLTLLGIAFDCGFNSKSTFNSIFKKREGMTPSAYKTQTENSGRK